MRKIILTAAVLALSACGFHLKGAEPYDRLPYRAWLVSGGALQQSLENALRRADGEPVDAPQAQAAIEVTNITTQKDVLTITRAAIVNEYLLVLQVEAQATRNGKPLGEPMKITVRRALDYADSEVLGKQEEKATIWQDMRQDAAQQIVRRLAFLNKAP